MAAPRNILMLL